MSTASPTAAVEAATATVTTYLDIVLPRNTFAVSPSVTVEAASITVIILILPWKIITNSLFSSRCCGSCSRYCNYIHIQYIQSVFRRKWKNNVIYTVQYIALHITALLQWRQMDALVRSSLHGTCTLCTVQGSTTLEKPLQMVILIKPGSGLVCSIFSMMPWRPLTGVFGWQSRQAVALSVQYSAWCPDVPWQGSLADSPDMQEPCLFSI